MFWIEVRYKQTQTKKADCFWVGLFWSEVFSLLMLHISAEILLLKKDRFLYPAIRQNTHK